MPTAAIAPTVELPIAATRVQLFPGYGTWFGRNGAGPYTIADRAQADRIIAATVAAQGTTDLMFDYDHQSVFAPAVAGTAIAAGWFSRLSADDRGIWAEGVQWTAAASARIGSREYRYVSPYFLHDKAGRITRIINAGLVNVPNFDLQAVAASALRSIGATISADERAIIDRLGMSDAVYLDARRDRELADAAAFASANAPVAPRGQVTAAEREIIEKVGMTVEDYIAVRDEAGGNANIAREEFTEAERAVIDRLGIPISAYIQARQDAQMTDLYRNRRSA